MAATLSLRALPASATRSLLRRPTLRKASRSARLATVALFGLGEKKEEATGEEYVVTFCQNWFYPRNPSTPSTHTLHPKTLNPKPLA